MPMRSWGRPPAPQVRAPRRRGPPPPPRPRPPSPPPLPLTPLPPPRSMSRRCLRSPECSGSPDGCLRLRVRSFSFLAAPATPRTALTLRSRRFALPLRRSSCRARTPAVLTSRFSRLPDFLSSLSRSAARASTAALCARSQLSSARSTSASSDTGGACADATAPPLAAPRRAAFFVTCAARRRRFAAALRWQSGRSCLG